MSKKRDFHEQITYLRNTPDKDLTTEERKAKKQLLKQLDSVFLKKNEGHKKPKLTADGRKRISTMMKPELKTRIQAYGNTKGYSIADVIELAVMAYLGDEGF